MKYSVSTKLCQLFLVGVVFVFITPTLLAQNKDTLALFPQDVRIEKSDNLQGFFLYIRKKSDVNSVLLTESSETPSKDINTYAFRTFEFNDINGNEKRVLNGRFIQPKQGYFVVDSTPEPDSEFGYAFVMFIPNIVYYGYSNTRSGKVDILQDGLYMSIRTFSEPYADYSGQYSDNSFYLEQVKSASTRVPNEPDFLPNIPPVSSSTPIPKETPSLVQESIAQTVSPNVATSTIDPSPPIASSSIEELVLAEDLSRYSPDTLESFTSIAAQANSKVLFADDSNDIITKIAQQINNIPATQSIDIVLSLDTTRSMWDDLSVIKTQLIPTLNKILKERVYRIGIIFYKDTDDEYVTKVIPFDDQLDVLQRIINQEQAGGGGDWPESVYEAVDKSVNEFTWIADERLMFIIGDAPAKEPPHTKVDIKQLFSVAAAKNITICPIIVPRTSR